MTGANGEKPTFDFGDVSYKWARKMTSISSKLMLTGFTIGAAAKETASEEDRSRLLQAQVQAMENVDALIDERDDLIAQVLVDVPRAWLISTAPAKIDWKDRASLEWIRADRFNDLTLALNEAQDTQKKLSAPS